MRLSKFLLFISLITFFAFLYVWQQTEIFRQAYVGQKKNIVTADLLDKNTILRYNLEKQTSLIRIGSKISEAKEYEMPEKYKLVKLGYPLEDLELKRHLYKKENLFFRIFGIKRQAEAKTINP
ncbi:MAG: hypothetical protein V2A64_02720 [Candidatus Omnitrophota bacterium]